MATPSKKRRNVSQRLPFPVSVDLFNVFPLESLPHTPKKWFRPEYTTTLLHQVCLDIVIQPEEASSDDFIILYSSMDSSKNVCPSWRHLNEHYRVEDLSIEGYESMKLQFSSTTCDAPFLQVPAHPSKLVRIAHIPPNLPVNAAVVHYSDESIRVPPALYQLLLDSQQEGIVVEKEHDNFSRFKDDVFRTLDQVTPVRKDSLLETDDEDLATPILAFSEELQKLDHMLEHELLHEQDRLEKLLAKEQTALKREMEQLHEQKAELQSSLDVIHTKQEQAKQVQEAIRQEQMECSKAEFRLDAQRIQLVRELRTIYPIEIKADQRYRIRGLEIPSVLYSGAVVEEEIAAALGYLCHWVMMVSKYLSVELRYRLHSHSSRSAIKDDRGTIYPLFPGRLVEREQLEQGVELLSRNVECICKARGIHVSSDAHALVKAKRIYDSVIDGYQ